MRLAVISDTHVPSRAEGIPGWVADRVRAADHTVHAGDFDSPAALQTVQDLADGNLTAVTGNMDGLGVDLPDVATVTFEGVTFVVCHGTGSPQDYRQRVAGVVRENGGDVGVSGHTHRLLNEWVDDVRLLNPGSATGAAPAEFASMMTVDVADGELSVTVHEE